MTITFCMKSHKKKHIIVKLIIDRKVIMMEVDKEKYKYVINY